MYSSIHCFDSLLRVMDSIRCFDSLLRFFASILCFDSLLRFKTVKNVDQNGKTVKNLDQTKNRKECRPKSKTLQKPNKLFRGARFFTKILILMEKPDEISKWPLRSPGPRRNRSVTLLCVFVCPLFERHENP